MVLQILFLGPSNLLEPNASFAQMSQKLIVSPIVKTLVFNKVPEKVCKPRRYRYFFIGPIRVSDVDPPISPKIFR